MGFVWLDEQEVSHLLCVELLIFAIIKPYKARAPSTSANQLTVGGFYPKAGPVPELLSFKGLGQQFALNAGSIWDDELHTWMAYRDLIKHPNPKIRDRWNQAGINTFSRLAQGHGDTEGLDVVTFIPKHEMLQSFYPSKA